jgi:uncharacterized protein (DUF2336 family)
MNPQQEYTLKATVIGALRGLVDALETQQAPLLPRAVAYQDTAVDLRATQDLRQIAADYGVSPEAAEQRYWKYVEAGWREHEAFNEVLAELDHA